MNLKIRETSEHDLDNIINLWANGEVMKFVGFPQGLQYTKEEINSWYRNITANRPYINHYSIYLNEHYCGETFYKIDPNYKNAAMDIKILPKYQGRGIASLALSFAINKAFENGAYKCWVDPNTNNEKAISLYERLGFKKKKAPLWLDEYPNQAYYEIDNKLVNTYDEESNRG